jgi:hypothetical protein
MPASAILEGRADRSARRHMNSVHAFLAQYGTEILLALCAAVALLALAVFGAHRKLTRLKRRWAELLSGSRGDNLELLLVDHLRERTQLRENVEALEKRLAALEEKVAGAKRHLGLVRYDAFEDVGGAQSFALALFDDRGDGAILNGLVGRTDCRVYCKPLQNGRSERSLSQE